MALTTAAHREPLIDAADDLLAGRAADGDERAFAELVRRHGPLLRVYARRILGGSAEVDDVVQETLITAWRELGRLQDGAAVRPWLLRIASRKAFDRIRAQRPQAELHEDVEAPAATSPARVVEHRSRRDALEAALSGLPEQQKQSWLLHEAGGLSYAEIGTELGVPASTVRGMLARARKHLIVQMEPWR